MHAFGSNQAEILYECLKKNLSKDPFARRVVIVPSPAMKNWLMIRLAEDLGVAAGLEISSRFNSVIEDLCGEKKLKFPDRSALTLAIDAAIQEAYQSSADSEWTGLFRYLKMGTTKEEKRKAAFAQKLAALFHSYGIYAGEIVKEWTGWQGLIWKAIFEKHPDWTYPAQILEQEGFCHEARITELHLFSLSYLPKLYLSFLQKISASFPVHLYLLTPCQSFWSDILSDRESAWVHKQKKSEELREYLADRNPLLANMGKLGRKMAQQLEESGIELTVCCALPTSIQERPEYEDLVFEDVCWLEKSGLNLLEGVQADLASMRNPNRSQKIVLENKDLSVQIHAAASRRREVEVLLDVLLGCMTQDGILPGEIFVMAPDIMEYAPLIKAIFGAPEVPFDYQLMDHQTATKSSAVQAFLQLIHLGSGRWEASALLALLENSSFVRKQYWKPDQLEKIKRWMRLGNVRWGWSHDHRNSFLQGRYQSNEMIQKTVQGTWEGAFESLLKGVVFEAKDKLNVKGGIEGTQAEFFGDFIQIFKTLRDSLSIFSSQEKKTLEDWCLSLKKIVTDWVWIEANDSQDQLLLTALDQLSKKIKEFPAELYAFTTIYKLVEQILLEERSIYREGNLNAVRFCSMLPMRAVPAQVVVLMGLADEEFPKCTQEVSINVMTGNPKADYCPSQNDYDRFLFLEGILSARSRLILTYPTTNGPSLLVGELLNYLDSSFASCDGCPPSSWCLFEHPWKAFDASYFSSASRFFSYSYQKYGLAQGYYGSIKKEPFSFISQFSQKNDEVLVSDSSVCVALRELRSLMKNPLKIYFKQLGIYLRTPQDRLVSSDESLHFSSMDRAISKRQLLTLPFDKVCLRSEKGGKLPQGPLKKLTEKSLREGNEEITFRLKEIGVTKEQFFSIELAAYCEAAHVDAHGNWIVPALEVEMDSGENFLLTGKLTEITSLGWIPYLNDTVEDRIKALPEALILAQIITRDHLPIIPTIYWAKSSKLATRPLESHAQTKIQHLLKYYLKAKQNPSPLLPEWISLILKSDVEALNKKISDALEKDNTLFYHEEFRWLAREGHKPSGQELIDHWQDVVNEVFYETV